VGYAGGTTSDPTYYNIGDYSETVQVDYDPTKVSYARLLEAFWSGHYPTVTPYSRQYRSAIFYADEEQQQIALESKTKEESRVGAMVMTDIIPAGAFYLAEEYHQKYNLRQNMELNAEMSAIYPSFRDFLNSTATARINGYLGGYGDPITLKKQVDKLGLSETGQQELIQMASYGLKPACPVPVK
jgi:peptide-methionine (S)-S-oxide reductase